ncbi:MAG: glycoside hydrolase family 27 protein [Mediterranea sp.]|jgi:alpha-galactosidase|nr:glycoside hydrolase family 27 protein [Mediterranea sp.]
MKRFLFAAALLCCATGSFAQKFEGLAKTPTMGWNSWNTFRSDIDEQLVKEIADQFVALGLKDAGYEYVCLDDCWMSKERDAEGNLVPDPKKFPNGMKAVADYVHSKGLKFGLYECAGTKTCAGYPGSHGHEYQDALKYAEWGVDFLKYDCCNTPQFAHGGSDRIWREWAYTTMRDALYAAGRPILFNLCEWGGSEPWLWGPAVGHSWRATGDIGAVFDPVNANDGQWHPMGIMQIVGEHDNDVLRRAAGPGHWNDLDMLEVGNGDLTLFENQTHFALWAMLCSPLIMGNDIRQMSEQTKEILTNREIIALNQDELGIQAFKYETAGDIQIWAKPLSGGDWAFLFLNYSAKETPLTFYWTGRVVTDRVFDKAVTFDEKTPYRVRDLYAGKNLGTTKTPLKVTLGKNQSLVVRLSK